MNEPAAGLTPDNDRFPLHTRGSQSSSRKSRSISRYFLGSKRSSVDASTPDVDISRCLTSAGVFDRCERWTSATLFRGFRTCQRLLIITDSNQLIVGKSNPKQSLFKIKHRIDLHRVWLHTNFTDYIPAEITSLTYYDRQRALIIGWPLADNFLVEFDSREVRESWHKRMQSALNSWWQLNSTSSERVRVVIDQHQDSDSNNNSASFLIRKVISIRPQDTVRDLIKKCIDTSHLQNSSVDDYVLYVLNDAAPAINPPLQANPTQLIPLIGHEYPYAIKMKHLKASNNISFDADDHSSLHSHHNSSTTSLNNISAHSHDFELRKRDAEHSSKKHRFFHKRKTKENCAKPPMPHAHDDYQSSSTATPVRRKPTYEFFGQTLDELMKQANNQLPGVLQQLLEVLYFKGPETTGIFRKVANTRSVKESIEKIERRLPLKNDDLHPILAAGIFKHFLRNLPDPVFNAIQYDHWKKCLRLPTLQEKVTFARRSIIGTLSEANHLLLKGFICVLSRISQNADSNGMNPFNLGLCVSNSLFKTESTTITSGKQEADVMSSIVEFMILNCSSLFGSDVLMCIPDKRIVVHQIPSLTRPAASSIESLDEVESSPHLPVVNRSRDSGLATSDQPFNDDSSEISEHFRRLTPATPPDWTSSIACGNGTVITSVILPTAALSITRCRNLKSAYKPSKRFMERDRQINDTTDDSEHDAFNGDSSVRSSTTTVHNLAVGKIKRSKPISRHSSLGSNEHHYQQQQQLQQQQPALTREPKRPTNNDVKRASSLKQFHHLSDEGDDDDEQNKTLFVSNNVKRKVSTIIKKHEQNSPSTTAAVVSKGVTQERRSRLAKSKNRTSDDESMTTRSTPYEQHDLDLTSEPLNSINQRLTNSSALRSASFTLNTGNKHADAPTTAQSLHPPVSMNFLPRYRPSPATLTDDRLRSTGPLIATTNQIYITTRDDDARRTKAERDRTFIHHADSRPFKLGTAIQMKPVDEQLLSSANGRCRPCHRQNALRYKTSEQDTQTDRSARTSAPMALSQNRIYSSEHAAANIPRYQSIERRTSTPAQQAAIKAFAFESNAELRPCDISWSVREKAKIFEHATPTKLSTGRENYV